MYSHGPPHLAEQKQDDQLKHTYSSYVRIRDVALKTCRGRWTIGKSGERGSGISVLAARHDDDDDLTAGDTINVSSAWWHATISGKHVHYLAQLAKHLLTIKTLKQGQDSWTGLLITSEEWNWKEQNTVYKNISRGWNTKINLRSCRLINSSRQFFDNRGLFK